GLSRPAEAGAFLLGASEPVTGLTFRAPLGRVVLGRRPDCDLQIPDRAVSACHAELMVRPEGATLTSMMATHGTRVNGQEVQSTQVHDGDVIRLGRVNLVFGEVAVDSRSRSWIRQAL